MAYLSLSFIFFKEQFRTPFGIFWTILSPVILFFFIHLDEIENISCDQNWIINNSSWFMGYMSVSITLFSYCLYLSGRRESGFLSTFIHDTKSKLLFIISQMTASLLMSYMYFVGFLLIVSLGFGVLPGVFIILIATKSVVISLFLMLSLTCLSSIPFTFHSSNVFFSMLFTALMILGVISFKSDRPIIEYVNFFNPIMISANFVSKNNFIALPSLFFILFMSLISLFCALRFRTEPVWSSQ